MGSIVDSKTARRLAPGALGNTSITELIDVDTDTAAPNIDEVLAWDGTNWIPTVISTGGVFGISDVNGIYTYYTDLTTAITASSSGDTIEVFADITETAAVEIILKDGVNINGNGHTYTLNSNSNLKTIKDNGVSVNCKITDYHFKRLGTVLSAEENLNYILEITNANTKLDLTGSSFTSDKFAACRNDGTLIGGYFKGNSTRFGTPFSMLNLGKVYDSIFESSSELSALITVINYNILSDCTITGVDADRVLSMIVNSTAYNCTVLSTGTSKTGIYNDGGKLFNCSSKADGVAISCVGGAVADNCSGTSTGSHGFEIGTSCELRNSTGSSSGGQGIRAADTTTILFNCTGKSDASHGITAFGKAYNCTGYSTAGAGIASFTSCYIYNSVAISTSTVGGSSGSEWYNCTFESLLDSAAGDAYANGFVASKLMGCTFKVKNAAAHCISCPSLTASYANSNFIGATVPVDPTTTQGITNLHDNQGNILI